MNILKQAFIELFPEKEINEFQFFLKYSDKFKPYNANVKKYRDNIEVNLSKKWRKVSKEIQIGLIQSLFLKLFRVRDNTTNNIDLYNIFMKKVHVAVPKIRSHPVLETSFHRVNGRYFDGLIEKPNLVVGSDSKIKLGSYEYGSDTVTISNVLIKEGELLDYVMYHELLHKKHKFHTRNNKNFHHTKEFKIKEREFINSDIMEKKLNNLLSRKKPLFRFRWFK